MQEKKALAAADATSKIGKALNITQGTLHELLFKIEYSTNRQSE